MNKIYNMKEMKKYFVEYKDGGEYGYGQEIMASSEDQAVRKVQMELLREDNYMSRLMKVEEVHDEEETFYDYGKDEPVWSIKDGPELDQESQDTLNYAFDNCRNEDGGTLRQAFDQQISTFHTHQKKLKK